MQRAQDVECEADGGNQDAESRLQDGCGRWRFGRDGVIELYFYERCEAEKAVIKRLGEEQKKLTENPIGPEAEEVKAKIAALVELGKTIRENQSLFLTPEELEKEQMEEEEERNRRDKETELRILEEKNASRFTKICILGLLVLLGILFTLVAVFA